MNKNKRGAGILLHITSLPSKFGIGDLGPEAYAFADFLNRSGQKYWQILPLNSTEAGQGHSPYSSTSSHAGNTLLISPELLVREGLLDASILEHYHMPSKDKVDFEVAERVKIALLNVAWINFKLGRGNQLQDSFDTFCTSEALWLNDFALYMLLKKNNKGLPWYEWEDEYKLRNEKSLQDLSTSNKNELEKIKFFQYIFFKQWHDLKDYVNDLNIKFFGDLPFYVSYDSADVWSHRELFGIGEEGKMTGVAGVPPDAFSDDGQLWGMPIFKWDVLKKTGYTWWIDRIKKNMELFDLLRLDHFRAFADYWEVAAGEETAKNGEWNPGPGDALFLAINRALGDLPFIAEDLGDINQPVYDLRDQFNFPGMKVLQFAFGDTLSTSPHIPHNFSQNFVVYTGTHDNNTIKGWYRNEGKQFHHQLDEYIGRRVSENEIHTELSRLAYASVANLAILPLQDVLGLDEEARMNKPASQEQNWLWRLLPHQLNSNFEAHLKHWVEIYNR